MTVIGPRARPNALGRLLPAVVAIVVGVGTTEISQGKDSLPVHPAITPPLAFTGAQLNAYPNGNWIDYGGNSMADRYSRLSDIDTTNAATLHTVWHTHFGTEFCTSGCSQSAGGLVYKGTLYLVSAEDNVFAMDAATGRTIWSYAANLASGAYVDDGGGVTSRGLAIGAGKVYLARLDDIAVALDAATGAVVWQRKLDSYTDGAFQTAAPTYIAARTPEVVFGVAGGEIGVRGYAEALDAGTGATRWKTYMVPAPGEPGYRSWGSGLETDHGGAPIWTHAVVDYRLGNLYVGTGNASPYVNREPGNDLYTASDVALNYETGAIVWYYQTVHHDQWDYDIGTSPVLVDEFVNGKWIYALDQATKMGYNFILDRKTGKPLIPTPEVAREKLPHAGAGTALTQPIPSGTPFGRQCARAADWVAGGGDPNLLGPDGIPIVFGCVYTPLSAKSYTAPGFHSVANWPPSAYNPKTKLVYVCSTNDRVEIYKAIPPAKAALSVTRSYTEVSADLLGDWIIGKSGVVSAIDPRHNTIRWQLRLPDGNGCYSGNTTAGSVGKSAVLFVGEASGHLLAVGAMTGRVLWTSPQLDAGATAPAIVYSVHGKEYVTVVVGGTAASRGTRHGDSVYSFALPSVATLST